MKLVNSTLKRFFNSAQLLEKKIIANHTFHLRIKLNSDSFNNYIPGQHLSMLVGLDDTSLFENPTRCYSVWNYDSENQEVDIAACINSNGIGTIWLKQLREGDTIYFSGPEGKFTFSPNFENYFFFGDSSALGHLYNIRRQLSQQQNSVGLFYSIERENLFSDLNNNLPFEFESSKQPPYDRIKTLLSNQIYDTQKTIVYIAGETEFCVTINKFCRQSLKLEPKQVRTKPFWHPSKKGLE
jgi:NADPH-dependent ferric siderophore reductase